MAGPIARCVGDLRLALELISGPDGHYPEVPPVPWQQVGPAERCMTCGSRNSSRWRPGAPRLHQDYELLDGAALGAGISRCTRQARLVIPSADWACMAALTCGPSSGKSRSRWNRVRPPSTVVSW